MTEPELLERDRDRGWRWLVGFAPLPERGISLWRERDHRSKRLLGSTHLAGDCKSWRSNPDKANVLGRIDEEVEVIDRAMEIITSCKNCTNARKAAPRRMVECS
jgi:hypothetical protein